MLRNRFIRRLVGHEIDDVLQATSANLARNNIDSMPALRSFPVNVSSYSEGKIALNKQLKRFLFDNFYRNYRVVRMAVKAERLLRALFDAYSSEPRQLPPEIQARIQAEKLSVERVVCDYLAGMTDRYAIQEHNRLFDPEERV